MTSTPLEQKILELVTDSNGEKNVNGLCKSTEISKPVVLKTLKSLEQKGEIIARQGLNPQEKFYVINPHKKPTLETEYQYKAVRMTIDIVISPSLHKITNTSTRIVYEDAPKNSHKIWDWYHPLPKNPVQVSIDGRTLKKLNFLIDNPYYKEFLVPLRKGTHNITYKYRTAYLDYYEYSVIRAPLESLTMNVIFNGLKPSITPKLLNPSSNIPTQDLIKKSEREYHIVLHNLQPHTPLRITWTKSKRS